MSARYRSGALTARLCAATARRFGAVERNRVVAAAARANFLAIEVVRTSGGINELDVARISSYTRVNPNTVTTYSRDHIALASSRTS